MTKRKITDGAREGPESPAKTLKRVKSNEKAAGSPKSSQNIKSTDHNQDSRNQNNKDNDRTLIIHEKQADLFAAPPHTLLIHACNTQGHWGAGIALAFKRHYPFAFKEYAAHCTTHKQPKPKQHSLTGTALLISPASNTDDKDRRFVGCLFTSAGYGRRKDSKAAILANTKAAMTDLMGKVGEWNERKEEGERIEEVWMCRINAGLFNVAWEETRAVLESVEVPEGLSREVVVVSKD